MILACYYLADGLLSSPHKCSPGGGGGISHSYAARMCPQHFMYYLKMSVRFLDMELAMCDR